MSLLSRTISGFIQPPFVLFQSSIAQSSIPLLRQSLLSNLKSRRSDSILLFCLAYRPSSLLSASSSDIYDTVQIFDRVELVPGYDDNWSDPRQAIFKAVEDTLGSIHVIIDSVDTLSSDVGTAADTYSFLFQLLRVINSRPNPSSLWLHLTRPSKLISLLTQPRFSPHTVQLIAHPSQLLRHLATDFLILPPKSNKSKFWSVFLPLSERIYDIESLVYGINGDGGGRSTEMVVELLQRTRESPGRKRGIDRDLEGWTLTDGACDWDKLETIKDLWSQRPTTEDKENITHSVSFNLNLTPSQQQSRARVPLPYMHNSKVDKPSPSPSIFYNPDSGDDIDDDDPDEDLDI